MRKTNSIISIIMVFLILFTTFMPNIAMGSHAATIHITSAQDLVKLSQDCSFDRFSQGITVFLEGDIDLEGQDFLPIPIFGGSFEGQGYTISGLSVSVDGSNQGLFRYLQEGAIIKDLSLEGVITPVGEKSTIGGIVGDNKGVVENCSFSGFVKGKDIVGGIVGWNRSSGMVINCSFNGAIYGESKVGGVVGYNSGTVLRCSNDSKVNTTVEDNKLGLTDITLENINLTKILPDATDIGGIAGINTGIIQSSENHGTIGYPHVGYNVGGIAGRQSGYITKCINYGSVFGRKEVAGIVGQIEPHITSIIEPSKLKNLQRELNTLDSSITKVIQDTKSISNTATENFLLIQDKLDGSKIYAESLIDQTEAMINKDMEEINKLSVIGIKVIDELMPIMESLTGTLEIMDDAIYAMRKSLQIITRIMRESTTSDPKLMELMSSLEDSINEMNKAKEKYKMFNRDIKEVNRLLRNRETDGVLELLKSAFENLKDGNKSIKKSIEDLKPIFEMEFDISEMIESLGDIGNDLKRALDYMLEAIVLMEDLMGDMLDLMEDLSGLLGSFMGQEGLKFETTSDLYEKTKEDLYGSISEVSTSLTKFITDINSEGNKMMDDVASVSDQMFKIMSLMVNLVEELTTGDISKENIVKDVSGEDIEKKTEGKVSDSKNLGPIEGDLNVGGIAGGMSIELFDPEVDLNLKGKLTYNTVFETRAIISRCENRGSVVGKKNGVGGIVGSMDLGYIKDCIVSSSVGSLDGNYVGGIAGKSDAPIVSSFARCSLEGGNYIGGISGLATEILDSYSMVKVNRGKACIGAIAGNIDNNNNIKTNYFVSHVLRGIDGISYMNKAEPITYEELITVEDIPSIFKEFSLNFLVDEKIVHRIDFNYGDSISDKDLPNIPTKEGFYGKWEEFDTRKLSFDEDIHAIYTPYLTILESKEKRDDTLAIILVEGLFTEVDSLTIRLDNSTGPELLEGETQVEQWNLVIPDDGETSHRIRYLPLEKKDTLKVNILSDGIWKEANGYWDGKYLVFETVGNNISFSIVEGAVSYMKYALLLAIVVLIIIILITYLMKKKKRKLRTA